MALFKVLRGKSNALSSITKKDGYAYFCTDEGSFWIDYIDDSGTIYRKKVGDGDFKKIHQDIQQVIVLIDKVSETFTTQLERALNNFNNSLDTFEAYINKITGEITLLQNVLLNSDLNVEFFELLYQGGDE